MSIVDRWLDSSLGRLGYAKLVDLPSGWGRERLFSGESSSVYDNRWIGMDDDAWERLAITSSWVYSDTDLVSKEASRAGLGVHQREGEQTVEIVDHDFEKIIRRPNPEMGMNFLMRYTLLWWLLRGEAYWLLVNNMAGDKLVELWPIPSNRMRPVESKSEYIAHYLYYPREGAEGVPVPREQVAFFRFPNPFDYHRGLSPLTAYRMALKTDLGAQKWNQDTFSQGVPFRTILSISDKTSPVKYEQAKVDIREQFEERRRMMIVRGGDMNAQELGLSQKDLEFLAGREFTREEIDRVFGVPAGFWAKEATRANSEAARASLIDYAVWPLLKLLCEQVDAQVLIPRYGEGLTLVPEDIRHRDRELQIKERDHRREVQTFDEARQEISAEVYTGALADAIGDLPVTLATDPQFVLGYLGFSVGSAAPGVPEVLSIDGSALKADVRRWRSVALRLFRDGDNPASYEFSSEHISDELATQIRAKLGDAESEADIKTIFESKAFDEYGGSGVSGSMPLSAEPIDGSGHAPIEVEATCPLCAGTSADEYPDHGGLRVCKSCGCTYDPALESA